MFEKKYKGKKIIIVRNSGLYRVHVKGYDYGFAVQVESLEEARKVGRQIVDGHEMAHRAEWSGPDHDDMVEEYPV